jgi:serine/threonine-protein kinase
MTDDIQDNVAQSQSDLSGRQLGDYQLLRRLGRGAMAEVYLAEQQSLGRQVAIKVLRSDLAVDDTYVKRFQREAQAVASLVHANIVQIHEVGCIDRVYFIAQEYVKGLNLRQWLNRHGTLDLKLALVMMRQVAAALAKAAQEGIVHRDVKPENIMLSPTGEVKVADFGLARLVRLGEGTDLTQVGVTMGTPLYMSPEQAEGKPLDPRSDLYSFGVTCYHVLSGQPPFSGDTALSVAVQHLKKTPERLETLRPDLPPGLSRIVHKMLAKDPQDRYQSAGDLLKELRRLQIDHLQEEWPDDLLAPEVVAAMADTTGNESTRRLDALMKTAAMDRPSWKWPLAWIAGVLIAFAAGAVGAFYTAVEPPLLSAAAAASADVPRFDTVERQFLHAVKVDTEEAWLAVIRYFGKETILAQRAKQQLTRRYLLDNQYDRAMEIFVELANRGDPNEELRVFGVAGQFCVLTLKGDHRGAAMKLQELDQDSIQEFLKDGFMLQLFWEALRTNRSGLNKEKRQELQKWFDEQFPEPEAAAEP